MTTKYEWTENKSFIRCHFTIVKDGKTEAGMQMYAKDPSTGELRWISGTMTISVASDGAHTYQFDYQLTP